MKRMIKKTVKAISPGGFAAAKNLRDTIVDTHQTVHDTQKTVQEIEAKLSQADYRLERLKEAYKKVDPYQPLYGVAGFGDPQRGSRDRAVAIYNYFNNNVSGMRLLDIGCYFGYLTFYFADRGAWATGWDYWQENIDVCNRLKDINGVPAAFKLKEFGPDATSGMEDNQYDVALILSVLHWTIHEKGLAYVQDAMKQLMDRVPVVVVELAQKGEGKYYWNKAVPARDLDIFNEVDDIKIEKIGDFPTHLSGKTRPLYVVSKQHVTVNANKYLIEEKLARAYNKAPAWRSIPSKYYLSGNDFIKESFFETHVSAEAAGAANEINFLLQKSRNQHLKDLPGLPELVDYEIGAKSVKTVIRRIEGSLLASIDKRQAGIKLAERVAAELSVILAALEHEHVHHNDIRSWNVLLHAKSGLSLIDFELSAPWAQEDEFRAFAWTLNTALTGDREATEKDKKTLPPKENFAVSPKLAALHEYIRTSQQPAFKEIVRLLSKTKSAKAK